jgi:hypothetical protein
LKKYKLKTTSGKIVSIEWTDTIENAREDFKTRYSGDYWVEFDNIRVKL